MESQLKLSHLVNKAYISIEKGDFGQAVSSLETACKLAPQNSEIHAYLGEAYILNEQYQKAQETFDLRDNLVLNNHPLTPYVEGYRGRIHLEQGQLEEAKTFLQKEAVQAVDDPEILYSRALLEFLEGNNPGAIEILQKIDRLEPAYYHRKIGTLFQTLKQKLKNKKTPSPLTPPDPDSEQADSSEIE